MIRILLILLLLLAGAGSTLNAQDTQLESREDEFPGPISTLLELHSELGLTVHQTTRLLEIEKQLDTRVEPLVERTMELWRLIRALGPEDQLTPEARKLFDAYVAEIGPLIRTIRDYNQAAMVDVGAVLSEPQKDVMAKILEEWEASKVKIGESGLPDPGR